MPYETGFRVSIAFDDNWNDETPTYTRLDQDYKVEHVSWERGRDFETDTHDAGTALIRLRDHTGAFDPTWVSGTFYGKTVPRRPAKIELRNPVSEAVAAVFTGFTSRWRYEVNPRLEWNTVEIELVDGMAIVAEAQILANGTFGDVVVDGNIVYQENSALDAPRTCIVKVLDEIGWPGTTAVDTYRQINSGNVGLLEKPYAPRTSALTVIQECAEADFPSVAGGFYFSKDGKATYFGRYTRLNPSDPDYGIQTWRLGDDAASDADVTQVARVSTPLVFYVDDSTIFNEATCTPQGIADADIPGQLVEDTVSRAAYGKKTWSAEGLRTRNGAGPTTANEECQKFAEFIVDNYAYPTIRVESLVLIGRMPDHPNAGRIWATMCGVELNDIVELTHTMSYGGGFADNQFFVEKITGTIDPLNSDIPLVTVTLDVSPGELVGTSPFFDPS